MCTHRAQHTFSKGGLTAAVRMDGITRPESMWAEQSKYEERPPHLLKPLSPDEQIQALVGV